jgi:hypothetical protein
MFSSDTSSFNNSVVVDNARKTIVEALAFDPAPSSFSASDVSSINAVENYQIVAVAFSPPNDGFDKFSSHRILSPSSLTDVSGNIFKLPDPKNFELRLNGPSQARYSDTENSIPFNVFHLEGGVTIDGNTIVANAGQDYAILEYPIESTNTAQLGIIGSSTAPIGIRVVRKKKSHGFAAYDYVEISYYNFDIDRFQDLPFKKDVEFKNGRINIPIDLSTQESKITNDPYDYFLHVFAPSDDLYVKGTVVLDSVVANNRSSNIFPDAGSSRISSVIFNGSFNSSSILTNVSGFDSSEFGLAVINGWEQYSPLLNSSNPQDEVSALGYVSLFRDELGDNFVRLHASSSDYANFGVGAAAISTTFSITHPNDSTLSRPIPDAGQVNNVNAGPFDRYAVINFDCRLNSSSSDGVYVRLDNITTGETYKFSDKTEAAAGWETRGTRAQVSYGKDNIEVGGYNSISLLAAIPYNMVNDNFKVTFIGGGDSGFSNVDIKNIKIGYLSDVPFGSDTFKYSRPESNGNTFKVGGDLLGGSGIVFYDPVRELKTPLDAGTGSIVNTTYLTYVTIPFTGMEPKKNYALIIDSESTDSNKSAYVGKHTVSLKLSHLDFCDILSNNRVNLFEQVGFINAQNLNTPVVPGTAEALNTRVSTLGRYCNNFRYAQDKQNEFHTKNAYDLMGVDLSSFNLVPATMWVPAKAGDKLTIKIDSKKIEALDTSGTYWICPRVINLKNRKRRFYDFKNNRFASETESSDATFYGKSQGQDIEFAIYPSRIQEYANGFSFSEWASLDRRFAQQFSVITSGTTNEQNYEIDIRLPSRSDLGSDYIFDDGSVMFGFEIFKQDPNDYVTANRSDLTGQSIKLTNFEILGKYKNSWNLTKAISTNQVPRGFEYDFSGSWSAIDFTTTEPYGLGRRSTKDIVNTYDLTLGEKVAIPVNGLDNFQRVGSSSRESTYALTVMSEGGPDAVIKSIRLVDAGLVSYAGPTNITDRSIQTSENQSLYLDKSLPNSIKDGWWIRYPQVDVSRTQYPIFSEERYLDGSKTYMKVVAETPASTRDFSLWYSGTIKDLGLKKGKYHVLTMEGFQDPGGSTTPESSVRVFYDFGDSYKNVYSTVDSEYKKLKTAERFDSAYFTKQSIEKNVDATITSDKFFVPNSINDDTIITIVMDFQDYDTLYIRKPRLYSIIDQTDVSSLVVTRPNPADTDIQPKGHFLNKIEFSGIELEEAFSEGAYPPASGVTILDFSGGASSTYYGNLNRFSVITENGYILPSPLFINGTSQAIEASSGFFLSSVDASSQQIKICISLSEDEWEMLNDHYGGIGAIGCYTLDREATAKKMGSDRNLASLPFIVSSLSGTSVATHPTTGPTRTIIGFVGKENIDAYTLKAQEVDADSTNGTVRGMYTTFASGVTNYSNGGWSNVAANTDFTIAFKYKVADNPRTPYVPTVNVQSHYFPEQTLTADGLWNQFTQTFTVTPDSAGHDALKWIFDSSGTRSTGENSLYITDVSLTSGVTEVYNTVFEDESDILDFHPIDFGSGSKPISIRRSFDGQKYTTSLYNENLLTEDEPVFRLFAKKVFNVGGLQKREVSQNGILIIWTLNFI